MPAHSSSLVLCIAPLRARPRAGAVVSRQWLFGLAMLCMTGLAAAPAPLRALARLLEAASDLDDAGKLLAVNEFFNRRIRFREDTEVWGQADCWLGVPGSRLRVQPHRVRAYFATPGAEPSILDNLVPDVLPAARRDWRDWRETVAKARAEGFP